MAGRRAALLGSVLVLSAFALSGCGAKLGTAPQSVAHWDLSAGTAGKIDYAEGVRIGKGGELLIVDTWNDRIVRTDAEGNVVGLFGEVGSEEGCLQRPHAVATDKAGNIYVVDAWNHRIQKFSPEGEFLLAFGSKGGPWGYDEADGKFTYPYGVAVDSEGRIYVSDFNNNRLQMFDHRGKFLIKWGTGGRQDGQFNRPAGLAMDSQDRLYVADLRNNRIQRFTIGAKVEEKDGVEVETFEAHFDGKWGEPGTEPGEFDLPYDVCVDPEDNFYVADWGNHRIQKFSAAGGLLWIYGEHGTGDDELDCPVSVAAAEGGVVYVSDHGNNRVAKLVPAS
jgi:DNA-binding beta-propeller fold protein YncE